MAAAHAVAFADLVGGADDGEFVGHADHAHAGGVLLGELFRHGAAEATGQVVLLRRDDAPRLRRGG